MTSRGFLKKFSKRSREVHPFWPRMKISHFSLGWWWMMGLFRGSILAIKHGIIRWIIQMGFMNYSSASHIIWIGFINQLVSNNVAVRIPWIQGGWDMIQQHPVRRSGRKVGNLEIVREISYVTYVPSWKQVSISLGLQGYHWDESNKQAIMESRDSRGASKISEWIYPRII